jgi:DNA-binding transcriptional ArsR family regulator
MMSLIIMNVRHNADMAAGAVVEALEIGMSAPAISRHLRVLLEARVIEDERLEADARARVFRLRPQSIAAVRAWLDEILAGQEGVASTR